MLFVFRPQRCNVVISTISCIIVSTLFLMFQSSLMISDLKVSKYVISEEASETIAAVPNSSKLNVPKNSSKPYFVFHVGPPKTATTTIQCGLSDVSGLLASKDSYYYLGKPCGAASLRNNETALRGHYLQYELDAGRLGYVGTRLEFRLKWHLSRGNNIVFSVETFGLKTNQGWDALLSLLKDWNVRIVVAYRRYYEWIPRSVQ